MPITIETSPALATGVETSTVTTGSFTPPAGSLLVASVVAASADDPVVSGGGLTWTRRVRNIDGGCELWTAVVAASTSMTVSVAVTDSGFGMGAALKVDVVSGQHPTAPIGNTGTGNSPTDNATITGYTSSGESRGFCAASDRNTSGLPSSSDVESAFHLSPSAFFDLDGMAVRKADDSLPGQPVTFNLAGAGDADWEWAALEILAQPAYVRPAVVIPVGAVRRAASW
ncbi:hypothetical protein [Nonomuraea wenchangensis]|uniref:hypothetical protein n=1 Tax=Nonomuraea wenchangensis TaxID=568860 RepID=UPI00332442C4